MTDIETLQKMFASIETAARAQVLKEIKTFGKDHSMSINGGEMVDVEQLLHMLEHGHLH